MHGTNDGGRKSLEKMVNMISYATRDEIHEGLLTPDVAVAKLRMGLKVPLDKEILGEEGYQIAKRAEE